MEGLRELHLFAGAGGGILGGILLGHTPVCAVEIEPYCRRILLQRQRDGVLPRFSVWDDVRTFDGNPWRGRVDVVCGGFPCQDISAAGKGAGIDGERSGLWSEFARIIREVRPRFVFVENSPMLTSRGLHRVLGDLAALGFDADWGVLGAVDAGAPHKRERIWILADNPNNGWREGRARRLDPGDPRELEQALQTLAHSRRHRAAQSALRAGRDGAQSRGDDVADAAVTGLEGQRDHTREPQRPEPWNHSGANPWWAIDLADADRPRCEEQRWAVADGQEHQATERRGTIYGGWWAIDPADEPQSGVGRMAHGVANRVDRLKAIGNGQVSVVAALAWEVLS